MSIISHPSNLRRFHVFGGHIEIDMKMPELVSFTSKMGEVYIGMCALSDYLTNIKEFGSAFEEQSAQPVSFSQKSEFSIELNFQVFGLSGMPRDVSIFVMREDPNNWIQPPGGAFIELDPTPSYGPAPPYDLNSMNEKEIDDLKNANAILNQKLLTTKKAIRNVTHQNEKLGKTIANVQLFPDLEERLNLKITDLTLQLKDVGRFQSKYYDLCKKMSTHVQRNKELEQAVKTRNAKIATLDKQLNTSGELTNTLKKSLADVNARNVQLEEDLMMNRVELADLDRKLSRKNDDLEEQLRMSQLENAELRVSLESKSNTTVDDLKEQLRLSQLKNFKLQETLARKTTVEQNLVDTLGQNSAIKKSLSYLEQKYNALIKRFKKADSEKKNLDHINALYLFQCEEIKAYKQVVRQMDSIKCGDCEKSLVVNPEALIYLIEQPRADFYANKDNDALRDNAE